MKNKITIISMEQLHITTGKEIKLLKITAVFLLSYYLFIITRVKVGWHCILVPRGQ